MAIDDSPANIQKPDASTADPFALFGLEPDFDLDVRVLRARWMRVAAEVHPDASGATLASAKVNDAFRVLCDPLSRAEALVSRFGFDVLAKNDDVKRALPPAFLMEMMELREQVDCLEPTDRLARTALRDGAKSRREVALKEIGVAFRTLTKTPTDKLAQERAVRAVFESCNVVRSFDRMLEQLDREFGVDSK
jgi:molecular chaperone HscB